MGGRVKVAQTFASQKVCGFSEEQPQSSKTANSALPLLNPWDLPPGQMSPSKEKIAFLN